MDVIIVIVASLLVYFVFKFSVKKYLSKIYLRTGIKTLTLSQQIIPFGIFVPLFAYIHDVTLITNPIISIIIPTITVCALVFTNLKFKNPVTVTMLTVVQLLYGIMFFARMVLWIFLLIGSFVSCVMWGRWESVTYNPFIIVDWDEYGMKTRKDKVEFIKERYVGNGVMETAKETSRNMKKLHERQLDNQINDDDPSYY